MAKRTRPVEGFRRRYVWRLYLTKEQVEMLREQAGMCADLWNALLEICEERYRRAVQRNGASVSFHCAACSALSKPGKIRLCDDHRHPTEFDMGYWITAMLAECPEWRAMSTWTPRRVATSLSAAWAAFFRRVKAGENAGYPRYKSRRRNLSIPHRCISGCPIKKSDRHERSWVMRFKGVPGNVWARGRVPAAVNEWTDADIRLGEHNTISIAVIIDGRRAPVFRPVPVTVRFDLIDGFAIVNNERVNLPDLARVKSLDDQRADMQSQFDRKWPRGRRYNDEEWRERCESKTEITRLAARIARIRNNALHVWSKRLAEGASVMTIIRPRVKENTRTPRGDKTSYGAAVSIVSQLNRNTLSYAPAMAAAMLEYKAKELGIRCEVIDDDAPDIAIGSKIVAAGKALRRASRKRRSPHDSSVQITR